MFIHLIFKLIVYGVIGVTIGRVVTKLAVVEHRPKLEVRSKMHKTVAQHAMERHLNPERATSKTVLV